MYRIESLALFAAVAIACTAQQAEYAQCGGEGFTGGTTCTAGWTCVYSNPWYSQCLQTSSSSVAPVASTSASHTPSTSITPVASTSTTHTSPVSIAPVASSSAISSAAAVETTAASISTSPATSKTSTGLAAAGTTFKASFTEYGAGDSFGSPNCQTDTAACGFFTSPGFAAAVSQNVFGVGPGSGAGPACGTCWSLVGETDSSGNALSNAGTSIVVMVNNLCPASGNPLCSQNGLTGTNQYGTNVNFDLCIDSGASAAFFGSDGVGLAIGTATEVDCSEYSGTIIH